MVNITIFHNDETIKTYELNENSITIGRLPENTIPIANISISRRHVRIEKDVNKQYVLTDLNSLNGTFVNNKRISQAPLSHGDKIAIGKYTLLFETHEQEQEQEEEKQEQEFEHENENPVLDVVQTQEEIPDIAQSHEHEQAEAVFEVKTDSTVAVKEKNSEKEKNELFEEANTIEEEEEIEVLKAQIKKEPSITTAVLIETNKHVIYKIDKPMMTIGNSEQDDIFVEGFFIANSHITIENKDNEIWIYANKFMGRFKINGKKFHKHILQHKDRIEIGTSTFRYMENEQK